MSPDAQFIKTLKGIQEIQTREFGLPTEFRTILILVDGKRTVQEIQTRFKQFGNIQEILDMLLSGGFIELQGDDKPSFAATAAKTAAPDEETSAAALAKIKADLGTQIKQYFGLMATPLLNQLEQCATLDKIHAHAMYCRILIREAFNSKKADAFWDSAKTILSER